MIKGKMEALHVSGKPVSIIWHYVDTGGLTGAGLVTGLAQSVEGLTAKRKVVDRIPQVKRILRVLK